MPAVTRCHLLTLRKRFVLLGILLLGLVAPAYATAPEEMSYWVSMRGITEDASPSFIALSYVQAGSYSVAFVGCHGRTYYLQSSDAATVQASRTAGETVQIHLGEPGTTPQQSTVVCLIQADH
ncbi:MAG: hypothetical protein ABL973_20490 [Micropepsaceae bacterium]